MKINGKLTSLILGLGMSSLAFGQCDINASAYPTQIQCGQTSVLTAFGSGSGTVVMNENFNSGFGSGWSGTPGGTSFSNPCSPGGVDGTPHAWMDNNTSVPRTLTSTGYNLSSATSGVTICFDLLFAEQGDAAPCEGPDEADEGVYFQYSTDGGNTWIDIHYFDPNGGNDPQLVNWSNWCFQIPPGAITSNTMFRWHQTADSGADYDHWGIDNVQILQNDVNAEIVWLHDNYSYGVGNSGGVNPTPVAPTSTTTYTVQITSGTGQVCTTTVTVTVIDPVYDVDITATPSTVCTGDCATITGTAVQVIDPGGVENYANNEIGIITGAPFIPGFPPFVPNTPGSISASMNINIQTLNSPTVQAGHIQSVCINSLSVTPGFGCNGTSLADVSIILECPGGTQITLVNAGQLSGNTITNMCFQTGGNAIGSGSSPYTGTFAPNQPLTGLNGCTSNGTWVMKVQGVNNQTCIPVGGIGGWNITFDDPPIHGPVDYSWSPTAGLSAPHSGPLANPNNINNQACPTNTTNYVLTVSNGVPGCATHQETVTITVDPCNGCNPPAITIDPLTTCSASTLSLANAINPSSEAATLTYHGTQANAQNDVSPISTTVSTSGSYWVRAEDPSDPTCFSVYEITVVIDSQDDASFTFDDFCIGTANAATNIATAGGTFSFNPAPGDGATINATTGAISNGVSGTTYTVQYSLGGGCPSSSTQTVLVSGVTFTSAVTGESCGNDDGEIVITTTSGLAPFTYSNDAGATTQSTGTFSNLSSQSYDIVVEDDAGCTATATVVVPVAGGPSIDDFTPTNPTCEAACDGEISIDVSGGTLPYTFEWEDENGNPIGGNSPSMTGLCEGDYTVSVYDNVTGAACAVTVTVSLTDPAVADASFTLTNFCAGTTNAATNIATPGGTFAFNPMPTDGATINVNTGAITNGVGGTTYSVEYTTGGACPVTSIETVQVNANPTPTISGNLTYCTGGSATLNAGSGYASYSWSIGGSNQTVTTTAATGITVTVTDANGCTGTSAPVNVSESNVIENFSTVSICPGASVTVHGNPVSIPGQYVDTFSISGGCDSISTVTVLQHTVVTPTITGNLWYCGGETATLATSPQNYTSYSWSTGGAQPTVSTTTNQPITVTVVDANGCSSTSTAVVLVHPPQAVVNANPITGTAPLTVVYTNNSTGASSYDWYIEDADTFSTVNLSDGYTHTYDSTGTYAVVLVAHSANCSDTAVIYITVLDPVQPLDAHIPNVFTPNGDGSNDFFTFNTSNAAELELIIVNRWGNLVYETDKIDFMWDGKDMSGKPVTEGVYFFKYKVIGLMGEEMSGHGFVTVER